MAKKIVFAIVVMLSLWLAIVVLNNKCREYGYEGFLLSTKQIFCWEGDPFMDGELYNIRPLEDRHEFNTPMPTMTPVFLEVDA